MSASVEQPVVALPDASGQEARRMFSGPWCLLPLAALWLLTLWLVPPRAEFPLNDDWIYAKVVQKIVNEHRFELHPFAASNMVGQAVIGALFTLPHGFSFDALRLSTLVLALVAAWSTARAGREIGLSAFVAVLCGSIVFWNPLFLNLSYTFMTDVPFIAFTALSGWFFLRALRRASPLDVVLASGFAAYAFMIRQFGVLLPLAYALAVGHAWYRQGRRPRVSVGVALLVPWVVAAAFVVWWRSTSDVHYAWPEAQPVGLFTRIGGALRYALTVITYLGLFLLPFALARTWAYRREKGSWTRPHRWLFVIGVLTTLWMLCGFASNRMPFLTNMLRDFGVGPLTLPGAWYRSQVWAPVQIGAWWWPITLVAIASGVLLAVDLWLRFVWPLPRTSASPASETSLSQDRTTFLVLWAVFMFAAPYNPWAPVTFDRYLLPGLLPVVLLVAWGLKSTDRRIIVTAAIGCACFYVLSIVFLQDYLVWNRARWASIDYLHKQGVTDEHIEGGYEFNGMYTSDEAMRRTQSADFNKVGVLPGWVLDDEYVVSLTPRYDFDIIARTRYHTWLGGGTHELLILHRQPGIEPGSL